MTTITCNKCTVRKNAEGDFYKSNKYTCKECVNKRSREWLLRPGNREKKRAYARKAAKLARLRDPERVSTNKKRSDIRLKREVFSHYGKVCCCCGEDNLLFLTLDHVNNDGAKHRQEIIGKHYNRTKRGDLTGRQFYAWLKKKNDPNGRPLQVMCYNCNCGKAANLGICPHKGVQWKI